MGRESIKGAAYKFLWQAVSCCICGQHESENLVWIVETYISLQKQATLVRLCRFLTELLNNSEEAK